MTRGEIEGMGEEETRGRRIGRRVEGLISFVGDQGWIVGKKEEERKRGKKKKEELLLCLTQTNQTHSSS